MPCSFQLIGQAANESERVAPQLIKDKLFHADII